MCGLQDLYKIRLPKATWVVQIDGKASDGHEQVWCVLHAMSVKAQIHSEWDMQQENQAYDSHQDDYVAASLPQDTSVQHIKSTFQVPSPVLFWTRLVWVLKACFSGRVHGLV